jgi:N-acetylneuraminic acid mutarotase
VLVAGGYSERDSLSSAELYDPVTGNWTLTGNMTYARYSHTASTLMNGAVLVTGGYVPQFYHSSSAELYDPVTSNWTLTENMIYPRIHHTASVLLNGTVLVTGGYSHGYGDLSSAELYDL